MDSAVPQFDGNMESLYAGDLERKDELWLIPALVRFNQSTKDLCFCIRLEHRGNEVKFELLVVFLEKSFVCIQGQLSWCVEVLLMTPSFGNSQGCFFNWNSPKVQRPFDVVWGLLNWYIKRNTLLSPSIYLDPCIQYSMWWMVNLVWADSESSEVFWHNGINLKFSEDDFNHLFFHFCSHF